MFSDATREPGLRRGAAAARETRLRTAHRYECTPSPHTHKIQNTLSYRNRAPGTELNQHLVKKYNIACLVTITQGVPIVTEIYSTYDVKTI